MKPKKPYHIKINSKTWVIVQPGQDESKIREKWDRILGVNLGLDGTKGSNQIQKGFKNKSQK